MLNYVREGDMVVVHSMDRFARSLKDLVEEVDKLVPGKIYKIKHEHSDKKGPKVSQVEAGSLNQMYFNTYFDVEKWSDYGIDEQFYINQCNLIIDRVDPEYKRNRKIKESGQLMMFN